MRARSVLDHPSQSRTPECLDGEVLPFLHPRCIAFRAVLLNDRDRLATVYAVSADGMAVQVGDGFDCRQPSAW